MSFATNLTLLRILWWLHILLSLRYMSKVQETKRAGRWLTFWIMPWYGMLHHGHLRLLSRSLWLHGLRTPGEEIVFTERPKIHSHSQIFSYDRSIFCLPHQPRFLWFMPSLGVRSPCCATLQGRNPYNFWFTFWENRWLQKLILKFTDL